jgi:hypothetical protein
MKHLDAIIIGTGQAGPSWRRGSRVRAIACPSRLLLPSGREHFRIGLLVPPVER